MKMVITLKNGVQIKADVETFATDSGKIYSDLRNLSWTATERPTVQLNWLNIEEVVAVHAEYERDQDQPEPAR